MSRTLKMSSNTIRQAREKLITAGLISISIPDKKSKSINGQSVYQLLTVSISDTVEAKKKKKPTQKMKQGASKIESPTVSKIESPTVSKIDTNIKLSYDKLSDIKPFSKNGEEKMPDYEILPDRIFLNDDLNNLWSVWEKYLRNKHFLILDETIKQAQFNELQLLSNGDEEIIMQIINQAVSGGYKGFAPLKNRKTFQEMQYDRRRQQAAMALQPTQPIHENEVDSKPINPWAPVLEMLKPINQNLKLFGERIDISSQSDEILILTNGVEVNRNFEFAKNGKPCNIRGVVNNKQNTRV